MIHFYPRSPCGERPALCAEFAACVAISIHVPLAGNVLPFSKTPLSGFLFLSTFPLRGTSGIPDTIHGIFGYFYPRSPCGERHEHGEEGWWYWKFLSTFPLRGTSFVPCVVMPHLLISIHVPLAGNVSEPYIFISELSVFLSTFPLRGTSSSSFTFLVRPSRFLSTFPLRGTSVCLL